MIKKRKSPKFGNCGTNTFSYMSRIYLDEGTGELMAVLDIIQGLSLLHYDSKKIAGHQQRIDVRSEYGFENINIGPIDIPREQR